MGTGMIRRLLSNQELTITNKLPAQGTQLGSLAASLLLALAGMHCGPWPLQMDGSGLPLPAPAEVHGRNSAESWPDGSRQQPWSLGWLGRPGDGDRDHRLGRKCGRFCQRKHLNTPTAVEVPASRRGSGLLSLPCRAPISSLGTFFRHPRTHDNFAGAYLAMHLQNPKGNVEQCSRIDLAYPEHVGSNPKAAHFFYLVSVSTRYPSKAEARK